MKKLNKYAILFKQNTLAFDSGDSLNLHFQQKFKSVYFGLKTYVYIRCEMISVNEIVCLPFVEYHLYP